ncbi:hypothetical protein LJC63_00155 [Ruminococcaceae bacterium OttesenSCG-928-L11]|nr:hypothetical protein [Ruminococcaceae bacterium OttesenSCG-928-L11]
MEQEKLYSPVNFFLRDKVSALEGQYDDVHYWRDEITHEEAFEHIAEIRAALADDRQHYDQGRGLAEYLGKGPLNDKVQSLIPHVELHDDQLWTVAHLQLNEPLTSKEMADLKSWWGGQLSDGWGEGFEQREIIVDEGALYVEPWTSSGGFFIATQAEFDRRRGIEQAAPGMNDASLWESLSTRDALLEQIAKAECRVVTLESRNRDSLDFYDISVRSLKKALDAAFDAGVSHQMAKETAVQLPEPEAASIVDEQSLRDALTIRLEQNMVERMTYLQAKIAAPGLPQEDVVALAERISATSAAYDYLQGHNFLPVETMQFLLQFGSPLELVAEHWPVAKDDLLDFSMVLEDVMENSYHLDPTANDEPAADTPPVGQPTSGKPSLLAGLREAQARAANENAIRAKDKPTNHPEPEL